MSHLIARHRRTIGRPALAAAVLSAFVAGCGDGRPDRVRVAGRVTVDGQPVQFGFIQVLPENARAASGRIETDGRFTLSCFEIGDGCVPGDHRVIVDGRKVVSPSRTEWYAPQKYANPGTSGLTVAINSDTDDLLIELASPGAEAFKPFAEVTGRQPKRAAAGAPSQR
ncbi:hypothetical protein [Botrimarina sp.]|uniref:hypothetical protein n=1 Tax=Botrimarina sp. TaxID=2795802 RepID=UPI0032EE90B0